MFCSQRERGLLVVRRQKWYLAQRLRLPPHHVLLRELPPALLLPGRLQDDHRAGAEALHALPVQVGVSAAAAGFSFNDFVTNLLELVRVCISNSRLKLLNWIAFNCSRQTFSSLVYDFFFFVSWIKKVACKGGYRKCLEIFNTNFNLKKEILFL